MSSLAAIPTIDPIPTMPAGLTPEAQQELNSLAVSLRSHFTILQQTAVQIALITYRLIDLIGDSAKAQAYSARSQARHLVPFALTGASVGSSASTSRIRTGTFRCTSRVFPSTPLI